MGRGYIEIDPITKRKFYFKDWKLLQTLKYKKEWKKYAILKGKYERACLNYIIQGSAGSITKLAAIYFRQWILKNNLERKVFITNLIHDEINVETEESLGKLVAENLEISMKNAGKIWCKTIPLDAEAVISKYWTH